MAFRRTDAQRERTAEERERAREERERRRNGEGSLPAPEPVAAPEPLPAPEPAAAPEPVAGLEPAAASEPLPALEPAAAPEPVAEPAPPEPEMVPAPDPPLPEPDLEPMSRRVSRPELRESDENSHHLRRPHLHRPHLYRPHLHRPHMPHPHVSGSRSWLARLGALIALLVVLGALAAAAVVIERRSNRKPVAAPKIVKVVIPEGLTRLQIAELAHTDGLHGSYLQATRAATELKPAYYGAPAHEHSLEGFLFPATYELYAGAPAAKLVAAQLSAFAENFGASEIRRAKALGVTPYGLLTVASMVEREAALPRERPLVAAVIYNRLRQGTPLGIDATIRYALRDYTHPLTEAQLRSSSPYNTRTHPGLPPTPISNPGSASIEAAAHPAHVSYLYYVARADGCPGQVFSSSYAQFQRDAAAYLQALRRNHGRVPSCRSR